MNGLKHIGIWGLVAMLTLATGCRKLVGPTNVEVVDNGRHYVPILQSDVLRMFWTIRNHGPEPLVIEEVQPSCSAIELVSSVPDVIIAGDSVVMIFDFDTDKNINMAKHYIRVYGNILPNGEAEMWFDINIVRHTVDRSDFEEHYFDRTSPQDVVRGRNIRENGYYIIPANADNLLGL